jgi:hypothetical protein
LNISIVITPCVGLVATIAAMANSLDSMVIVGICRRDACIGWYLILLADASDHRGDFAAAFPAWIGCNEHGGIGVYIKN